MGKNIQKINLIFKDIFVISLIFYLIFLIINIISNNFLSYYINLNFILWIVIISGLIYACLLFIIKKL